MRLNWNELHRSSEKQQRSAIGKSIVDGEAFRCGVVPASQSAAHCDDVSRPLVKSSAPIGAANAGIRAHDLTSFPVNTVGRSEWCASRCATVP